MLYLLIKNLDFVIVTTFPIHIGQKREKLFTNANIFMLI